MAAQTLPPALSPPALSNGLEQSFNYTTSSVTADVGCFSMLSIKMSQEYNDEFTILDEAQQIVNQYEFYDQIEQAAAKPLKAEFTVDTSFHFDMEPFFTATDDDDDDDSISHQQLGTVNRFSDVMLGAGKLSDGNTTATECSTMRPSFKFDSQESLMFDYANVILTPAASPDNADDVEQEDDSSRASIETTGDDNISNPQQGNHIQDDQNEDTTETPTARAPIEREQITQDTPQTQNTTDHNYTITTADEWPTATALAAPSTSHNKRNAALCKRKLQLEEDLVEDKQPEFHAFECIRDIVASSQTSTISNSSASMRLLRSNLPLRLIVTPQQPADGVKIACDTPEITKCILDLEEETTACEFDLVDFINSSQVWKQ